MRYTEQQMTSELLDQPMFEDKPRRIFVCSTPRSGSYMLCRYMINAGLGVPHEYFNPIIMQQISRRLGLGATAEKLKWRRPTPRDRLPFGKAARAAEMDFLEKYTHALIPRRCKNGFFAAKVHYEQYIKVLNNKIGWDLLDGGTFVYLYREDLLKQAISTRFSFLTGRWSIDDTVTTAPAKDPDFFDISAINSMLEMLADEDYGWRMFFAQNGISPIFISYEQFCIDPFGFVKLLAGRVGLEARALRRDYEEPISQIEGGAGLPSKSEIAQHYLAATRKLRGAPVARAHPPEGRAATTRPQVST